jgi:hypothetical protein
VFGSSGGAVVGLALVTAHPDQVHTLIAREPPVIELLPDNAQVRAQIDDIYDTYRADGADKAMQKFMAHAGLGAAPSQDPGAARWEPSPQEMARMRATTDQFLAHLIRPTTRYRPDIAALRAAPTRIVVAAGATSGGQLANRAAVALADQLGSTVVDFPGDHGGFLALPERARHGRPRWRPGRRPYRRISEPRLVTLCDRRAPKSLPGTERILGRGLPADMSILHSSWQVSFPVVIVPRASRVYGIRLRRGLLFTAATWRYLLFAALWGAYGERRPGLPMRCGGLAAGPRPGQPLGRRQRQAWHWPRLPR